MYPDIKSRSFSLLQRAERVMPGGNSRLTIFFNPYPLYAARGEGPYVYDVDGNRYIDFISNYSALIHGHNFPPVTEAIRAQAGIITGVGLPTESEIELAELICERVNSIERIRFCNSGSEAVMMAIKAARAYTGRPRIAKIEGSYHGSYDPVEVSQSPTPENWGQIDAPSPVANATGTPPGIVDDTVIIPLNDIEHTSNILDRHKADLAAVIFDPMMSRLGYVENDLDFVQFLRRKTQEIGALFIADEVYSFRLAYHGAQSLLNIKADLTTLGKIIGGGIPIGAVGGRTDVMDVFSVAPGKPKVPHGGTFNANPLAMTAGLAAMRALTPDAYARLDELGERLRTGLRQALLQTNVKGHVNGGGSLVALLIMEHPYKDYRGYQPQLARHGAAMSIIRPYLINKGILITNSGHYILSTAMNADDIDAAIEYTTAALHHYSDTLQL